MTVLSDQPVPAGDEGTYQSSGPDATRALAGRLAEALGAGSVLALHGDLGAGKTCFVQGLAEALEVTVPVSSPTFTLVNEYPGRLPLYHIDLYRIADPEEALDFGLEDYLYGQGVTVVEWAERAGGIWPDDTLHLTFCHGEQEHQRSIAWARGKRP